MFDYFINRLFKTQEEKKEDRDLSHWISLSNLSVYPEYKELIKECEVRISGILSQLSSLPVEPGDSDRKSLWKAIGEISVLQWIMNLEAEARKRLPQPKEDKNE